MKIRFWGTRGSIPVALTSVDIRDKLALALLQASGRNFDSYEEAHDYASSELDFSLTHTFGGHTPCVEIETGSDEYFVCDMGSGARPFGVHVLARQARRAATVSSFNSIRIFCMRGGRRSGFFARHGPIRRSAAVHFARCGGNRPFRSPYSWDQG
jgi:hypothetical protein